MHAYNTHTCNFWIQGVIWPIMGYSNRRHQWKCYPNVYSALLSFVAVVVMAHDTTVKTRFIGIMMRGMIAFKSKERTPTVACIAHKSWVASPFILPTHTYITPRNDHIKDIIAEDVKKNKHFIYDSQRYSDYKQQKKKDGIYIYTITRMVFSLS